jgi:hypothetical protein
MPFYADPQYNTPVLVAVPGLLTASLTGTGTAVTGLGTVAQFPVFLRRTAVKGILVIPTVAPTGSQLTNLVFTQGTTVMGTATVGTATAGQTVYVAFTTNNTFAAIGTNPGAPTTFLSTAVGTATSAGTAAGIYQLWLDQQELYA